MADRTDELAEDVKEIKERVSGLAVGHRHLSERVDHLSGRVDDLSTSVDSRFDAVDVAIREQREYTEFAFGRLDVRFDRLDAKLDERFGRVDDRFGRLERKLDVLIDARPARRRPKRDR